MSQGQEPRRIMHTEFLDLLDTYLGRLHEARGDLAAMPQDSQAAATRAVHAAQQFRLAAQLLVGQVDRPGVPVNGPPGAALM
ncbi:hypothetical protein [Actinoplanes sp. HUAS TT8]|uniref:hypothetical protein n=1 Tax=Actinoplanes sp. HUAS TT8 TaxID=3447453 RepID=UPI003F520F6C